jgi:hypothetical protein
VPGEAGAACEVAEQRDGQSVHHQPQAVLVWAAREDTQLARRTGQQKKKGAKQVFLRKLWDGSCLLGAAAGAVLVGEGVLSGRRTGRARYDHEHTNDLFIVQIFYLPWDAGIIKQNHAASQISWLE